MSEFTDFDYFDTNFGSSNEKILQSSRNSRQLSTFDYMYQQYAYYNNILIDEDYQCQRGSIDYNGISFTINGFYEFDTWMYENTLAYVKYNYDRLNSTEFSNFCETASEGIQKHTEYTKLSYDFYCDPVAFDSMCQNQVVDNLASNLPDKFTYNHCQNIYRNSQIIQNGTHTNLNKLTQVMVNFIPFCSLQMFGIDEQYFEKYPNLAVADFLPSNCKASIISAEVFIFLLMILIIVCNSLVIAIMIKYYNLKSNQNMIKFSLAITDLMIGLFVFPSV